MPAAARGLPAVPTRYDMATTGMSGAAAGVCCVADISHDACRVNWKPMKASRDVQEGDIISCAGKGRLEIKSVSMTKKGKYAVEMVRLL